MVSPVCLPKLEKNRVRVRLHVKVPGDHPAAPRIPTYETSLFTNKLEAKSWLLVGGFRH
jgi:hypothetical protein